MRKHRQKQNNQRGFTLLEVMLVLIIIVTIASLVVVNILGQRELARKRTALGYTKTLAGCIDKYEFDMGRVPTTEQGLGAIFQVPSDVHNPGAWGGPYINETAGTRDPWGNEYLYSSPGRDGVRKYEVWSLGPDGIDGTDDDIAHWMTIEDLER